MSKVLIIGPAFFYFNQSIERAFQALGWETRIEAYDNPIHPYHWLNRLKYKLSADKTKLKERSRQDYREHIEQVFRQEKPALVFIMNGDNLLPDTLDFFRRSAVTVLWLFDSLRRMPLCGENLPHVDEVFCYEQEDIPRIRERWGIEAKFLPQAVDTTLYHPLPGTAKQYDLVFAGDLYRSPRRQRLMQAVVKRFGRRKIRVWGIYKPWYKNPWLWMTRERKDIYMNRSTTAEVLNREYNRARIVLNIHGEQQRNGANPKVYEIAASGASQICDSNPYIDRLLGDTDAALYHDEQELLDMIEQRLAAPVKPGAAYEAVVRNHTFEVRMRYVCQIVAPLLDDRRHVLKTD